jgi:DNA-binding NarL/FixJ family response regulator
MNTNEVKPARIVPVTDAAAGTGLAAQPIPIKVWLVDDDDSYRTLLAKSLAQRAGIECLRDFPSPDAVLSALASKSGPDVLLLDIHMRDRNGLDAVGPIKTLSRNTRVLMLTTLYDSQYHSRALEEGASGFLLKSNSLEEIVEQIRKPDPAGQARWRRRRKPARTGETFPAHRPLPARTSRPKWWRRFSSAIGFPA